MKQQPESPLALDIVGYHNPDSRSDFPTELQVSNGDKCLWYTRKESASLDELREQLAALAHQQWSGWMVYLWETSIEAGDGCKKIPALLVQRWERQMHTPYQDLPEDEKQSDRAEADKVLAVILTAEKGTKE